MVRFSPTLARLPPDRPFSAGPIGIMVATSPSIGATRVAMRGRSSRRCAATSSASASDTLLRRAHATST
ncbi:hypothetical protein D3C81_1813540 [compost metagenome]